MLRFLLPLSVLAACTPSPRKVAMPSPSSSPSPISETVVQGSGEAIPTAKDQAGPAGPASVAGKSAAPMALPDSPAAASGRRTLSTAFVRIGPDGYLTVERHDGHVLVLRDVTMQPRKYCGAEASGTRYCSGYDEVAAARPGGGPAHDENAPTVGVPAGSTLSPGSR